MPEVLVTKDDKAVTILSSRDFEEQIEKYIWSSFSRWSGLTVLTIWLSVKSLKPRRYMRLWWQQETA